MLNDRDLNRRRIIQEFLLIWLDINLDSSKGHNAISRSITDLSDAVSSIYTFMDIDECIDFLTDVKYEKVFMIVHNDVEGNIMSLLQQIPQLSAIFILSDDKSKYEQTMTKNLRKVNGIFTEITHLSESIKRLLRRYDEDNIPFSCITVETAESPNLDQLPPSFMYTQLIKEVILNLEYNEQSIKDFVTYFNQHHAYYDIDLKSVTAFAENYDSYTSIWWYTSPSFVYSILNKVLRNLETSTIAKMAFFIRDLHRQLEHLHKQQFNTGSTSHIFTVYRGQGLASEDFEKLRKTKGSLLSFDNFLSTSFDRDISSVFAVSVSDVTALIPILFHITVDTSTSTTPFACIDNFSYYPHEKEILFSMHTVFRIGEIAQDIEHQSLYKIELTLTDENDPQLTGLTQRMREELRGAGWHRMGQLMLRVGDFNGAEQLYMELLKNTDNERTRSLYFRRLATAKQNQGEYIEAVKYFEESIEIDERTQDKNDLDLSASYNDIALVYNDMGKHSKALEYHDKSIEIRKIALPQNHPDLATSYNNIALVYSNMGEYSKALEYHEKSHKILEIALPKNHPNLATSYLCIGYVYNDMGEYSKALEYYEKSIEIRKIVLPNNHPDLAISYGSIARVYNNMGEYPKALEYHGKSYKILEIAFAKNHPHLAISYSNIGQVYDNMGEYSKALEYYEKSIEIRKIVLPKNHPNLATSYSNIGQVYSNMGEYSKALEYHEKSIEIKKIALSQNHPDLATSYNNIGLVYHRMGEYSKALEYHEKSHKIFETALPKNYPDLATSYHNIASVYNDMSEYSKALEYYEKTRKVDEIALPKNHPNLATSYHNIALVYYNMKKYSKALELFERALEIRLAKLPPAHPHIAKTKGWIELVKQKL